MSLRVSVAMGDCLPLIREVLASGATFDIPTHGTSMKPLFSECYVRLRAVSGKLKRGDVAFYRRENGDIVLHRVVRVTGSGYDMCGDAQCVLERGVPADSVIGVMCAYEEDGRFVSTDEPQYRAYVRRRLLSRPFRRLYSALYSRIKGNKS